tara:strand:+ start:2489 stop:2911 length:423 start_codon:yes stop_codon:yes gene_type:complete
MNLKSLMELKESIGIFSRKTATSLNWPPTEQEIECAIDEEIVECSKMDAPFTGVPAPVVLTDDPWFGPAVISDANKDYMELEYEAFRQDAHNYYGEQSKEPENIHEVMYEMATKNAPTTLQIDPIGGSENFQGGSENVHR